MRGGVWFAIFRSRGTPKKRHETCQKIGGSMLVRDFTIGQIVSMTERLGEISSLIREIICAPQLKLKLFMYFHFKLRRS